MIKLEDLEALQKFVNEYPNWWYRIGVCKISYDFTAGPESESEYIKFAKTPGDKWDNGFDCMHKDSLKMAIHDVTEQIENEHAKDLAEIA